MNAAPTLQAKGAASSAPTKQRTHLNKIKLRRLSPDQVPELRRDPVDDGTLGQAAAIVEDVRLRGYDAMIEHACRIGDMKTGDPVVFAGRELNEALQSLPSSDRELLERTAGRIERFAEAQLSALQEVTVKVPGGRAGHTFDPVERAGCYAPGGRFPLPSSVLMTALTARVAGVKSVWVASPKPAAITLAAAAVSGAEALLTVGGAQAIAALAYGAGEIPACDVVVGPGSRWVVAAKQLVAGRVGIDMLAGPSEIVVLADASADPAVVAADLLAQAEHDIDAFPVLVSLDAGLVDRVDEELTKQIETLPTEQTASAALSKGFAVFARDMEEAVSVCDRLAPEHLQLSVGGAEEVAHRFRHYGALFIGCGSAEVLCDYGAGPNHVLPTGGTARSIGGLNVLTFLRVRTWLEIDDPDAATTLIGDAAAFARLEGLEGHARSAEKRLPKE